MTGVTVSILDALAAGRIRAAVPDPAAADGWRVDPDAKAAILGCFADRSTRLWEIGPLAFRDRVGVPPKPVLVDPDALEADAAGRPWRIVPGGRASAPAPTSSRASWSCRRPSSISARGSARMR